VIETALPIETDLLVAGAGPYGLGIAAYAKSLGLHPLLVGRPMAFWREQMPHGMFLRSSWDWHFDPNNVNTIEAWLQETGRSKASIDPFPLAAYLEFTTWFEDVSELAPVDLAREKALILVIELDHGILVHPRTPLAALRRDA